MDEPVAPSVAETLPDITTLRTLDDLPGPRGLPLLGNALEVKPKELHRLVAGWADKFGPLFEGLDSAGCITPAAAKRSASLLAWLLQNFRAQLERRKLRAYFSHSIG